MSLLPAVLTLVRRVGIRHMAGHPLRTFITLTGVAVGVAMLMGVRGITSGIEDGFAGMVKRVGARAELVVGGVGNLVPVDAVDKVAGVPGVAHVAGVLEGAVTAPALGDRLLIVGVDFLGDTHFLQSDTPSDGTPDDVAEVLKEPFAFLNSPQNVLLGRPLARMHGLTRGSTLEVSTPRGRTTLKVLGLLSQAASEAMHGGAVGLMNLDAAEVVLGVPGRLSRIDVGLAAGARVEDVTSALQRALGESLEVRRPETLGTMGTEVTGVFQRGLQMSSLVALMVALGIIFNTVLISVRQRRRELSILRALGATHDALTTAVAAEAAVVGALGGLLGALAGHGMARAALHGAHEMLSALYLPIRPEAAVLRAQDVLGAVLIGALASVVAALVPARAVRRISPVEGMRRGAIPGEHPEVDIPRRVAVALLLAALSAALTAGTRHGVPIMVSAGLSAALVFGAVFALTPVAMVLLHRALQEPATRAWGITGRLAMDNMRRTVRTGAANISGLATAALVVVALGAYVESFVQSLTTWITQVIGSPLVVLAGTSGSGLENLAMGTEVVERIRNVEGVAAVQGARVVNQPVGRHALKLRAVDIAPLQGRGALKPLRGDINPAAFASSDAPSCAISESAALNLAVDVGATIRLQTVEGPRDFRVDAVVVDYASTVGVVTVDRGVYRALWKDDLLDAVEVQLLPGHSAADVRLRIQRELGEKSDLAVQDSAEFRTRMDETVKSFFWLARLLIALAMVVAALGIINTLQANVLDRVREVGMLRAVGAQVGQVETIVVLEALAMSTVALVLGMLAGLGTGAAMIRALMETQTGWALPLAIPWATLGVNAVVTLVITALAARLPARTAARLDPVEALAWE